MADWPHDGLCVGPFHGLTKIPDTECWHGTLFLLDVPHHVTLIRVHVVNDEQLPVLDPDDLFGQLRALEADRPYHTIRVPGLDGDYVVALEPYCL